MMKVVLNIVTILQFACCVLPLSSAQHVQSLDVPGSFPSTVNTHGSRIVASSLDPMPADYQPPPWIDPFSSGTYSASRTPFFNWQSLMSSSSMSSMSHGTGQIPTIQLGEGIPVESVRVVEDVPSNVMSVDKATKKKVDTIHMVADSKQPSMLPLPSDTVGAIPVQDQMKVPPSDLHNPWQAVNPSVGNDMSNVENNFGVDPRQLSLDNPTAVDPSMLSPDNPMHAELIDFMIRKDMAKGTGGTPIQPPSFEPDPFGINKPSSGVNQEVVPNNVIPPVGSVMADTSNNDLLPPGSATVTSEISKTGKRKQKKAEKQMRQQIRQEQRKERQQQRKAAKQQERQQRKLRVFSDKLAAQKRRRKQRIQEKIEKHLKQLERISQDDNITNQVSTQNNDNTPPASQAFNVQNTIKEQNLNENTSKPNSNDKKQRAKKNRKGGKKRKNNNKRKNKGKGFRKNKGKAKGV